VLPIGNIVTENLFVAVVFLYEDGYPVLDVGLHELLLVYAAVHPRNLQHGDGGLLLVRMFLMYDLSTVC
jgi:hypothetical protein